jgi:1-acyl-sn-glycerol-3-phosphate acyltransferase
MADRTFDSGFIRHLSEQAFNLLNHDYFRAKILHLDRVPPRTSGRPRIFFSNHSGMAFPWDAIVFNTLYWEKRGFAEGHLLRPLIAPMLLQSKMMSPYMIDNLWERGGCLEASMENFEYLMHEGQDIIMYPEGVPGIGKGFNRRYQIQKFSTSFLRMAMQYDADLVPVHTINAEYLHPFSYRSDALNRFVQKLGVPFLPLSPLTALVPVFPWMFYFSLPANIHYVFGKPIRPSELSGKSFENLKRADYIRMRDDLHSEFQKDISRYVEEYGQNPFRFDELQEKLLADPQKALFTLPTGWPVLFTGLQALYDMGIRKPLKYTLDEFISLGARAFDGLSFTLPFSWPLVWGLKGFTGELVHTVLRFLEKETGLVNRSGGLHKNLVHPGMHSADEDVQTLPPAQSRKTAEMSETDTWQLREALRLIEHREIMPDALDKAEQIFHELTARPPEVAGRAWAGLSEICYWRGEEASEKLPIYQKGVEYGERGVAANPGSMESHFWLATNYGLLGQERGILDSLFLVKPIEAHLQRAMELDESYFNGAPHRALAWVLHKLPPWPLSHGDNKDAMEHMRAALKFGPEFPLNHLYAAEIALSLQNKSLAREHLEWLIHRPLSENHAREETRYKKRAAELLARLN